MLVRTYVGVASHSNFCAANSFMSLSKIAKSVYMLHHVSLHLSGLMEQLSSHWTDFLEIKYFTIFRKYVEKCKFH